MILLIHAIYCVLVIVAILYAYFFWVFVLKNSTVTDSTNEENAVEMQPMPMFQVNTPVDDPMECEGA